jgi:predicted XRE-type DNA-binding protein
MGAIWAFVEAIIKQNGWMQAKVAKQCGLTQPCNNDLLRGRIARFSIEALVNIASALGRWVPPVPRIRGPGKARISAPPGVVSL